MAGGAGQGSSAPTAAAASYYGYDHIGIVNFGLALANDVMER